MVNVRTDLASEAFDNAGGNSVPGIEVSEETIRDIRVRSVNITGTAAAAAVSKPQGIYYTMELHDFMTRSGADFSQTALALSELILRCAGGSVPKLSLIAALGNPDITPDAVGPLAASNILVTRHMKELDSAGFAHFSSVALCRTGVLGTTGLESAVQIKSLCSVLKPELVIAVDALAGSDASRLCRTVQISDSGIAPGSGVKNNRLQLNKETLGVPVIAVGVPTVIDAAGLGAGRGTENMFVCPREIDSVVRSAGRLIGYGINLALHSGLSIEDIDMLLG